MYHLARQGYDSSYSPPSYNAEREILVDGDLEIKKKEISELFSRENIQYFNSAMDLYNRTKRWGLPFSGGWAETPQYIIDALDAVQDCEDTALLEAQQNYGKK